MGDVVSICGEQPIEAGVPNEYLVKFLKDALERAEAGELQGIACGLLYRDGGCVWETITTEATYALIGATQTAATAIISCVIQGDDDEV